MDWLRKIVSGKRNRFQFQKFDLDITYITYKILAMSFPAKGMESMYRNNISNVSSCSSKTLGSYIPETKTREELEGL